MELGSRAQFQKVLTSGLRVEEHLEAQSMLLTSLVSTMQQIQTSSDDVPRNTAHRPVQQVAKRTGYLRTGTSASTISDLITFGCHCPKKPIATKDPFQQKFGFIFSKVSRHRRNCPLYNPGQETTTVGARLVLPGRQIRYFLEAAVRCGAGSISAYITARNNLPRDSTANRLVTEFSLPFLYVRYVPNAEQLSQMFLLVAKSLSLMFATGRAGPSDTLDNIGSTFLHVSGLPRKVINPYEYHP